MRRFSQLELLRVLAACGALLDVGLAAVALPGLGAIAPLPAEPLQGFYPAVAIPTLLAMAAVSAMACYDPRRYSGAIGAVAIARIGRGPLLGWAVVGGGAATGIAGLAALDATLGLAQLLLWRPHRT